MSYWKKKIKYIVNNSLLLNQRNMVSERKLFNGCLSLMLKKYKKIFCKQFVRIKKKLLTTEPMKYGLKLSVSV